MKKSAIARLIVGITILVMLYYKVGVSEVLAHLKSFNLIWAIPAVGLAFLTLFLSSFNIYLLLRSVEHKVPLLHLYKCSLVSSSIGLISPGRIGDFSLALYIKKYAPYGITTAVVLVDKIITTLTYMIIAFFGLFIIFNEQLIGWFILGVMLPCAIMGILFLASSWGRKLVKKFISKKILSKFSGFQVSFKKMLTKRPQYIVYNILVTLLNLLVNSLLYIVFFLGFNTNVSIMYIYVINAINKIIVSIPITLSGLGIRESMGLYLYGQIGAPVHITAGLFILNLLLFYVLAIVFVFGIRLDKKE